jgi:N-acetylglucosamine kinase-like BadF-type ATPase
VGAGAEFAISFWLQHPLGAAGLGDDALRAISLAHLGMAPETSLSQAIPEFYGAASVEDLLHSFTRRENPGGSHLHKSTAARTVLGEAEAGDHVAIQIVQHHVERVVNYIEACAAQVGLRADEPFTVTLGGSVVAADNILRGAILHHLPDRLPKTQIVTEHAVPILGTVLDALAEAGIPPAASLRDAVFHWGTNR